MGKEIEVGKPGWERDRSDRSAFVCTGPSMTEQSHKDSCDINVLMARYEKMGDIPLGRDGQPFFGDFTNASDFHAMQNKVIETQASFDMLPADLRKKFDHDPGKLLDFISDPSNLKDAINLGLLKAEDLELSPVVVKEIPEEDPPK